MDERIWPVILSGGSGTRLWPLSRTAMPKQLLALTGARTMLQDTVLRVAGPAFHAPLIVCGEAHAVAIAAQLTAIDITPAATIIEPAARNTAAAIALAALEIVARDANGVLLVMPSDHVIDRPAALLAAVRRGRAAVADGWLATFGIAATEPATGYGYIERGPAIGDGVFAARRFIEKPLREEAEAMLAAGGHDWNGGLFLFRADAFLAALAEHSPAVLAAARAALALAVRTGAEIRPDAKGFAAAPSISVDYAVMERAGRVAVIPVDMGWSDIGAWDAVLEHGEGDANGNVTRGPTLLADTQRCLVRSEGPLVATLGVEGLIVVATGDAVLVASASHAQAVRDLVARLPDPALATRAAAGARRVASGDGVAVDEFDVAPGARCDGETILLSGSLAGGVAGPEGARLLLVTRR